LKPFSKIFILKKYEIIVAIDINKKLILKPDILNIIQERGVKGSGAGLSPNI
jgi:hypothetical protein